MTEGTKRSGSRSPPSAGRNERLLIAATVAVAMARLLTVEGPLSHNDRSRWLTVRALVERGSFSVGNRIETPRGPVDLGLIEPREWRTIDIVLDPNTKQFYSSKPPLLSTVVAGLYWVAHRVFGLSLHDNTAATVIIVLLMVNLLPLLLYLTLFARLLRRYVRDEWTREVLLFAACFCTFFTPFVVTLNNHTVATFGALVALYGLLRLWIDGERATWRFAAVGLASMWAGANELPAAVLAFGCFALLLRCDARRALIGFLPAGFLPAFAYIAANNASLGTVLPLFDRKQWFRFAGSYWSYPTGLDRDRPSRLRYAFHFLVGHHGAFSLSPIYLLSMAGLRRALLGDDETEAAPSRRRATHAALYLVLAIVTYAVSYNAGTALSWAIGAPLCAAAAAVLVRMASAHANADGPLRLVLICTVVTFAFYLGMTYNYGGRSIGPRWLMWLTPLWLYAAAPVVQRLGASTRGRRLTIVAVALSALSANYRATRPWDGPWIYQLLGYQARDDASALARSARLKAKGPSSRPAR